MASGDITRMRLGVLHALGTALADAADTGDEARVAAVLSGNFDVDAPILPFPCRRETHGYIEAVYMLREETSLHDDEVVGIVCAVPPQILAALGAPGENTEPHTRQEATGSLPYCAAAALILNKITRDAFTPEAIRNPRIRALAKKVSCAIDPHMAEDESRITVDRVRGKPVECIVTVPLGGENNEMTADQVRANFRDDMTYAGHGAMTEAAIATVEGMQSVADTGPLIALFRKARTDGE
jgi:2-methylcitrate dehydratase PrpD